MRIALTIPYLPPSVFGSPTRKIYGDVSVGGAETWGWDFAQALRRNGIAVDVFTADAPALGVGWLEIEGLRVYRASVVDFIDSVPMLGDDYLQELSAAPYDVMQFSLFAQRDFCKMMALAQKGQALTIFSHHGCGIITPDDEERRRIRHALAQVDIITAPSTSSLEHYENTWIRRKFVVLPNGVDNRRFHPDAWQEFAPDRDAFRRETFGPGQRPVILFVGRLLPHKGLLFLLEAMSLLLERPGNAPPPRLVLGGTGDQRPQLEDFCRHRGLVLDDDVVFAGYVPDNRLAAFYGAADVFVLPSTRIGYEGERFVEPEAFGLVLTEAMACGTPCVGCDIPGVNSVITHDVNGLLAREGDAQSLADTLGAVLAEPALAERLRLAGLHTANAVFGYDRIVERFVSTVEQARALRLTSYTPPAVSVRRRLVLMAPSTTQFYSGQGRHIFEVARLLLDAYDIEIVVDNFAYANLKPLFEFADVHPVRLTVLRGEAPQGTLDPKVDDLRPHVASQPDDAILCVFGWANTYLSEAVLEQRRGRLLASIPYYQPTETVPCAMGELRPRLEAALAAILRQADVVFAISREEAALLRPQCDGDVRVSLLGVNTELFRFLPLPKEPLALFVGDLRETRKRLPLTLEVFRAIRRRHPQFRLLVIGKCDDLEALRRTLPEDVADAVEVSGYVPDDRLAEFYTRATLLINTASYEAFCIPLVEAMTCGTIPLVTASGGVPSVVDDGITGFLLDPDNPAASLGKVWPVLDNPGRLEFMRQNAVQAAFRDFSWSNAAEVFATGLAAAAGRRGGGSRPKRTAGRRLRVLVVNDHFMPDLVGGAEVYLHLLVSQLSRDVDITVLRHARRGYTTRVDGAAVVCQPVDLPNALDVTPESFDVVHFNSAHKLHPVHYGLLPADRTLIDMHDYWGVCPNNELVLLPELPAMRRCRNVYDAAAPRRCLDCTGSDAEERMVRRDKLIDRGRWLIAHSDFVADKLRQRFPDKDITRIHYGIRHRDFLAAERRRDEKSPLRVLFVGRISLTKGVTLLADMLATLQTAEPDVELLVAGNYTAYWDWHREFLEDVRRRGLEDRVRLLGQVPNHEAATLFALADVTIVPSLWDEPFGIVVIESLAAGCPVVASPYGGLGQIYEHETHSLYLAEPDARQLAEAILRLRRDRDLAARLSQAGRDLVAQRYTVEVMASQTLALYERIASAQAHSS